MAYIISITSIIIGLAVANPLVSVIFIAIGATYAVFYNLILLSFTTLLKRAVWETFNTDSKFKEIILKSGTKETLATASTALLVISSAILATLHGNPYFATPVLLNLLLHFYSRMTFDNFVEEAKELYGN